MKKAKRLKICDWSLLIAMILMLASGIQLEATSSRGILFVCLHIIIGCCFFADIVWHLHLHFGWKSWIKKFSKQKSSITRWLVIFALLTIISAVVAAFHWFNSYTHSSVGGVHGKIGFIFLALAIVHTVIRIKFFKNNKK